jgi:hypothetical protein
LSHLEPERTLAACGSHDGGHVLDALGWWWSSSRILQIDGRKRKEKESSRVAVVERGCRDMTEGEETSPASEEAGFVAISFLFPSDLRTKLDSRVIVLVLYNS